MHLIIIFQSMNVYTAVDGGVHMN